MWQVLGDLLRGNPLSPQFNNCANRSSSAANYGFTTQDLIVGDDVKMFGGGRHRCSLWLGIECYRIFAELATINYDARE
jgi:hypothetical protein